MVVFACARSASEVVRDRDTGMAYLREAAEQINKVSTDVSKAHIAGYSAGIAGSILSVVGGGLILGGVTAGTISRNGAERNGTELGSKIRNGTERCTCYIS